MVLTALAALWHTHLMKKPQRKALGRFIVTDPKICRGRPTFKGTRVTVADVLADVERGLAWEFICYRWGDGRITKEAVAEAVQLARRVQKHDPPNPALSREDSPSLVHDFLIRLRNALHGALR